MPTDNPLDDAASKMLERLAEEKQRRVIRLIGDLLLDYDLPKTHQIIKKLVEATDVH